MPKVFVSDSISKEALAQLEGHLDVHIETGLSEAELCAKLPGFDALMVRSATTVTKAIIEAAKDLQVIGRAGVGVDNIDVPAATARELPLGLGGQTGRLYRLPTEAEWEFACRGGTETPFSFGQTILSSLANYQADKPYSSEGVGEYRRQTLAVGSLGAANYFGLSDMHGNVAEWCEDIYGPYSGGDQTNPTGPASGRSRVVRGGGWRSYPWQCRSAARVGMQEGFHRNDIGFRVVLPEVVLVENPENKP